MNKQYDRSALVHAYIKAHQPYYRHEDFKNHALRLLDALQSAFEVTLSFDGVHHQEVRVLWMLFDATVRSYSSIRFPRSDFLDDSLINKKLEQLGERANHVITLEATIQESVTMNKTAHLKLLDELFVLLWGHVDTIVTSYDLRQLGFDDTSEPQSRDYLDDL